MKSTTASVPLLALVVLALTACGPTPPPGDTPADPRPTHTGSPTPIPVPTPTETLPPEALDPLDTVTRILLQTERVSFCDDEACGVDGFRYDESPDLAIAKLNAVFEIEPTVASYEAIDGSMGYDYRWGDAFMLYFSSGTGTAGGVPMGIHVTVASVGGVAIGTGHGVHVGTPWAEVVAVADSVNSYPETDEVEAWFDTVPSDGGFLTAIIAFGDEGGAVTSITGPIRTGVYS